jgi:predicted N-formylglutamate amidohydrolase
MGEARAAHEAPSESVRITNREAMSPLVLVCDHASNFIPAQFGSLGLDQASLTRHIAWDPGALPVATMLAQMLGAALVESRVSRLVADCNRAPGAPDLVPALSETTRIPANENLSPADLDLRLALAWRPFHAAIEDVVKDRLARGVETRLVSIHSFTPVYKDVKRLWHIGILHDDDDSLAAPMIAALQGIPGITVGDNQPYSPADGVYYTLDRHGRSNGLACAMVEIRNDQIADEPGQRKWAERLADILAVQKTAAPARGHADA